MDNKSLDLLLNAKNESEITDILAKFITENGQNFSFPNFSKEQRKKLSECLLKRLQDPTWLNCHALCLETFRIMSRDKNDIDEIFPREVIDLLVLKAGLFSQEEALNQSNLYISDQTIILEALKGLCNLVYHSKLVQRVCSTNSCVEGVMLRLKTYEEGWSHEIKYFDMRLLFLLTALCADVRPRLRTDYHGLIYLIEVLDLLIKINLESEINEDKETGTRRFHRNASYLANPTPNSLEDPEVAMACEVMKVLYNLTVNMDKHNVEEEDEGHFLRLACVLSNILLCEVKTTEKKDELQSQSISLLMNMPPDCYEELVSPSDPAEEEPHSFDGMNMEVISVLLDCLDKRLESRENLPERLMPILTCLIKISQSQPIVRRYLRTKILPPLKDVLNRPEEGMTTRNKLVRLMTSPSIQIKKLVANFLFILCKENAARLVKYTGYGNAAGLLASMGLMKGNNSSLENYSSDSEDSDTDEYLQYKEKINLVTGCYEEPKPHPLEGMTEEQKEYEAIQLVNMMEKLAREGLMRPMRIGPDGRPHPVEHILELQNDANQP